MQAHDIYLKQIQTRYKYTGAFYYYAWWLFCGNMQ